MAPPPAIPLPDSYAKLLFKEIRISHHPATEPSPTPVLIFTLYRPSRHNAFTASMGEELIQAFKLIDIDDRVRCVVVTGHGRNFCAGQDLGPEHGFKGGKERVNDHRDLGGSVVLAIHNCSKPVIGAIQGAAVGIGATMTLPMSIRVALSSAKIGFVFARRGLVMEACSSFFLPRLIGMSRALHLTTTGSVHQANDKLFGDLFSATYDTPERVIAEALKIAEEVAANTSVVSTYLMRQMMYRDTGSAEGQHLLDSRILYDLFTGPDCKEGVKAFLEKRPASFTGTMENCAPSSYPWWEAPDVSQKAKAAIDRSKL